MRKNVTWLLLTTLGIFALFLTRPSPSDHALPTKPPQRILPTARKEPPRGHTLSVSKAQAQAAPAAASAPSKSDELVKELAREFSSPGSSRRSEVEIQALAKRLSAVEISDLQERALDPESSADTRHASVYLLTQGGPAASAALVAIAAAPVPAVSEIPHTTGEAKGALERSLRITALEALDKMAERDVSLRPRLESILKTQNDSTLMFLTQVSLAGLDEGRPGKLTRFIDRALAPSEDQ